MVRFVHEQQDHIHTYQKRFKLRCRNDVLVMYSEIRDQKVKITFEFLR